MKDLAILIPSWKGAEYLSVCLYAINKNCNSNYDVYVVLNEYDLKSVEVCERYKGQRVFYIPLKENEGTLAVDHAIPYLKDYEFVCNLNNDMVVPENFDVLLIEAMRKYGPKCTVSSPAIEYNGGANGLDTLNDRDLPKFLEMGCVEKFSENVKNGKYKLPNIISQRHPVVCRAKDFIAVGGYSDNWDINWFPGYTLDFFFAYRLWDKLGIKKMISIGNVPVLHDYSTTMRKLPVNLQQKNCWEYFKEKTGMTVDEWKEKINFNKIVD